VITNCDVTGSPGTVRLLSAPAVNQQNLTITNNGFGFTNTAWAGQTFTPSVSGTLSRVDLFLFCSGCTGTTPNLTVSIRATTGATPVPTGADLAVTTIPGFSTGSGGYFTAQFASPATLTAGTRYAVVIRAASLPSLGSYAYACSCGPPNPSNTNPYPNGQRVTSANSGGSWSADTTSGGRDLGFVTYIQSGFAASGTFVSSARDANPAPGTTATWGTLSWNASVPAGTTVQFQAAASNSADGPFTFVGPNGTAGTFFANGASLSQFDGHRYLKYRAVLTTSNSSVTPSLQDVTICFNNVIDPATVTATVIAGGLRLQQLQNADGGWYFRASDTTCGAGAGVSCPNIIGTVGLGLLSAYERNGDPAVLADAIQAGQLLQSLHAANPARRPFSQDLEFLVALTSASGDAQYSSLATTWFGTMTMQYPNPADRADAAFALRNGQGLRTLAVWDIASIIRMAKAAGNLSYASGLANRVIARESEWKDLIVAHRWDQCANPAGCGPADNMQAFDYTLLGMGSMLWAIHDLPGFDTSIAEYRSWLLSQQGTDGTWDVGDLQITSYVALGLGAVGGAGTSSAIHSAVTFFFAHQLPNHGFPFSFVNGVAGNEYSVVDSEVVRAIDILYSTQSGQSVQVTPAQLATVTFTEVSRPGFTSVTASALTTSARVPNGYTLAVGLTYDVTTTATVKGGIVMCLSVPWDALAGQFDRLRILQPDQRGNSGNERFVDRTILKGPLAPDATAKRLCAELPSLDPIAVAIRERGR
jgi:hypothetical protein